MQQFLFCNLLISLVAILYCRYSKASIGAKLLVTAYSLLFWVVPFTQVRQFFPNEMTINVSWIANQSFSVIENPYSFSNPSEFQFSLNSLMLIVYLFGLITMGITVIRHAYWKKSLSKTENMKFVLTFKGIPVYSTDKVENALLVGYRNPLILINPALLDSEYREIIFAHEYTHFLNNDNYWLLLLEFIKHLYWWNPLVYSLSKSASELLEARCDYQASMGFPKHQYQQKLAHLILDTQTKQQHNFSCAVISKNRIVNRLQYLERNPRMSKISKLILSFLAILSLSILIIPVSSFKVLASQETIQDDKSVQIGALLQMKIVHTSTESGVQHVYSKETTMWTHFAKKFAIDLDADNEMTLEVKDKNDIVLIAAELYKKASPELVATPRLFAKYNTSATIEWGDDDPKNGEKWTITITPSKTRRP